MPEINHRTTVDSLKRHLHCGAVSTIKTCMPIHGKIYKRRIIARISKNKWKKIGLTDRMSESAFRLSVSGWLYIHTKFLSSAVCYLAHGFVRGASLELRALSMPQFLSPGLPISWLSACSDTSVMKIGGLEGEPWKQGDDNNLKSPAFTGPKPKGLAGIPPCLYKLEGDERFSRVAGVKEFGRTPATVYLLQGPKICRTVRSAKWYEA